MAAMIAAMSSTHPLHPPTHPPPESPADWPAIWQLLLQARQAPDGLAAGDGLLRAEALQGVQLQGNWTAASRALFQVYKPLLDARLAFLERTTAATWALAQLGQSLDGCVATATGDSYFVTGPQSLLHVHRLRALSDAVLVGAGTVALDNPQLTTRRVPGPQPVRVVLDPTARLDGSAQVLSGGAAPSLWVCDSRHAPAAQARTTAGAAEVLAVDGLLTRCMQGQAFDPARLLAALAQRGLRLVFIEGGGITVSRCLAQGVLNRLHLVVAPVLIGNGRPGLQWPGPSRMADCLRPPAQQVAMGEDVLWDLDLREGS